MDDKPIIQIENVTKKYNLYARPQDRFKEAVGMKGRSLHSDFYALNKITFDVKKGETVGIIGTNGSGKSTLLKIITGVLAPNEGNVEVEGRISALLELGAGFNQEYTGLENIYLNGRMMGYPRKEMEEKVPSIIDFAEIGEFINQPVKTYSSGMFARLAFAVAINVEPDILIVDEALSVGDLFFQNKCFRKFEELKSKNITILFVSHDIASVRQMCSRVLWIDKGIQVIFDQGDKVCDMYMDMKRQDMNKSCIAMQHTAIQYITLGHVKEEVIFPKSTSTDSLIQSTKVKIESVFLIDSNNKLTNTIQVERDYSFHVVVTACEDVSELIVGVVVENNKGIPLYDINNYISTGKVVQCKKGNILEAIFHFHLPRIMKGTYLVSAAVAQGTQDEHEMLTWLHGVMTLEVVNPGYNSSYIEIPSDISFQIHEGSNVKFE